MCECWSASNPEYLNLIRRSENRAGLQSIVMLVCARIIADQETRYARCYISSLPSNAERILQAVRKQWSIQNKLHRLLDVALNEDHLLNVLPAAN